MSKVTTLVMGAALLGLSALPIWADDAKSGSCWLRDAASPTPSVVYTLCEQGPIWGTSDGGATWTKRETGAPERLRAMAFLDVNRGMVIGDHGMLLATEDGGKTWKPRVVESKEHLIDITFVGESGWICGFQGTILHTEDGGKTWEKQNATTTQTLETVFFLDKNLGWSVGWAGTILRTTDGGKNWKSIVSDAASWSLTSGQFRDAQNGWMVGFAGQILRSRDGGLTWQVQKSPVSNWLTSIVFDGSNRGWITYDDGLLSSEDGGETWKSIPTESSYFLGKLLRVGNAVWAMGQSTMLKQGAGGKWERIASLVPDRSLGLDATPGSAQ